MKKKTLILICFTLFLIFNFGTTVSAESSPLTITSSESVFIAPTASFSVDISTDGATDLVGFQLKLLYDDTEFTFVSLTKGSDLNNSITVNSSASGELILNYVDISKKLNGEIVLFTLNFTANQTVTAGPQYVVTQDSTYNNEFISMDESNNISEFSSVSYSFNSVSKGLYGDVNHDESVSILDAALMQLEIAGLSSFTNTQSVLADVNGDSEVSISDVAMIQLYIAGLVTSIDPS